MKYKISIVLFLCLLLASCSSDNNIVPEPTPGVDTTAVNTVNMSVSPSVAPVLTKSGVVEQFTSSSKIGMFITTGNLGNNYTSDTQNVNVPAAFDGTNWTLGREVKLSNDVAAVYAYYPYNALNSNGSAIDVETDSQTDYLYAAKAFVNASQPKASLLMKHAMSLVSLVIKKNDYKGDGKVSKVEIVGVQSVGKMDIASGVVTRAGVSSTYTRSCDYTLNDNSLTKNRIISLPLKVSETSGVSIKVTVDGRGFSYDVPATHIWNAGYESTYTLNLHDTSIDELTDVALDKTYWSSFGREDNVTTVSNSTSLLRIQNYSTEYGRVAVSSEGKKFGIWVNNYGTDWKGKVRFALYNGTQLIEKYQAYNVAIKGGYYNVFEIPCFINCSPGNYRLVPLFRADGSSDWIAPKYYTGVTDEDWAYTVTSNNTAPSCRYLWMDGSNKKCTGLIYDKYLNESFNVNFIITNRAQIALRGEIKAVWERTFGDFIPSSYNDGNTWSDEIGRTRIDIAADIKTHTGAVACAIKATRSIVTRFTPMIHLYFKADGTDDWVLLRDDCDILFDTMKNITDMNIYSSDNITVVGGLTSVLAKYNTGNFLFVSLKN
jgi:hypothetical protein